VATAGDLCGRIAGMSSSDATLSSASVQLSSGRRIPLLGFGTWQLKGPSAAQSVEWALDAGYRLVDTATMYRNERQVGDGLVRSGIDRDRIFVTTKIPPDRSGSELETLRESLTALGSDSVDLWLIHWPPDEGGIALDIWQALIGARDQGLATDIGVSNYSLDQLDQLEAATGVMPAVNQIEWSPLLFDQAQLHGHRERGVVLEGYSALRGGTLKHPQIVAIAERLGRTPAQVIIRWHLQHEIVVIPKSQDRERIIANADVDGFELSEDDMATLDSLGPAA
jgi:diketogulonate reductase-like aldo/keto reductase